ncbi:MAG: 30S ribosomal protein S4 [Spirochaetota bacterium]|jgi:small subunit ribosomal protein S4|nr:30S ribosomal protein S4 [Spirochaetota bacterium]
MSKNLKPSCKQCKAEGEKLMLKGARCLSSKCPVIKLRDPGKKGGVTRKRKKKLSDYATQLREKQKVKRLYGILEKQFRMYYREATRMPGVSGLNLVHLLERRLDNLVYRMNFASSRKEARQLVVLGHILVNGRKETIPSRILRVGDTVEVKSRELASVANAIKLLKCSNSHWLEVDNAAFTGRLSSLPEVRDLEIDVKPQLIIELYSK